VLNLHKRAIESVGFMKQCAPHHPLPTGHHSNDLVPLPAGTLPDEMLYYPTSLDHRHLICRAITAGGCVERCTNYSPLITLGETPFVDVAHGIYRDMLATTSLIRVVRNIDFLEG